jgi:hypothetical protein
MKHIENLVRQLLNLDFNYEKSGHPGIESLISGAKQTGYVYFKAEDILPILKKLEDEVNEKS